jgi:ornithine cyclodeaminase
MQVEYLESVTPCRNLLVWGRTGSAEKLEAYRRHMEARGYAVRTTHDAGEVGESCQLIITATPAKAPLLHASQVRKGTHITAMGSDTPEKQELDPAILRMADIVVADSIDQCLSRGEIHKALQAGQIHREKVRELGCVIADTGLQRTSGDQITVADLTGVAVQDIQIAKAVFRALEERRVAS